MSSTASRNVTGPSQTPRPLLPAHVPGAHVSYQGCQSLPQQGGAPAPHSPALAGLVGQAVVIRPCPALPDPLIRTPFPLDSASQGSPWGMWHRGQWCPQHKAAYTSHCTAMQSLIPQNLHQRTTSLITMFRDKPCRLKGEVPALHTGCHG